MEWLKTTLEPIRSNRRAYRAINLAYYGSVLVSMAVAPESQEFGTGFWRRFAGRSPA